MCPIHDYLVVGFYECTISKKKIKRASHIIPSIERVLSINRDCDRRDPSTLGSHYYHRPLAPRYIVSMAAAQTTFFTNHSSHCAASQPDEIELSTIPSKMTVGLTCTPTNRAALTCSFKSFVIWLPALYEPSTGLSGTVKRL